MDKFSRDLTLALQETSGFHKPITNKLIQRRRSWSTGTLPIVLQPTEEFSIRAGTIKQLPVTYKVSIPRTNLTQSDSDDKNDLRMMGKNLKLETVESDSFNENFSPARLFKSNIRRKRKFKRMTLNDEHDFTCESLEEYGIIKKRAHKPEFHKSPILFSGKRKRSTKDRYSEFEKVQTHLGHIPKQNITLASNQGFPFSSHQTCDSIAMIKSSTSDNGNKTKLNKHVSGQTKCLNHTSSTNYEALFLANNKSDSEMQAQLIDNNDSHQLQRRILYRKKLSKLKHNEFKCEIPIDESISMEYGEFYYISSSSSLSSESDCEQGNDTDGEGDDELTDWPGNERSYPCDTKDNFKRKLTKKQQTLSLKVETALSRMNGAEINTEKSECNLETSGEMRSNQFMIKNDQFLYGNISKFKHRKSEKCGEKSVEIADVPHSSSMEIREIRAGCRRITVERLGFSIKSHINEKLAIFLQDATQTKIKLSDFKIYERESLYSLSQLYSLDMKIERGCVILEKTSKTTQSVNTDHNKFQAHLCLGDYKRRCYECK